MYEYAFSTINWRLHLIKQKDIINHVRDEESYLSEVLTATDPEVVIPIHWDNLSGREPLATGYPLDNLGKAVEMVKDWNGRNNGAVDFVY